LPDSNLIKEKVWDNLGIMRSTSKIKTLINWLEQFDFMKPIDDDILTSEILERRNLCIVAYTIAKAALERKESLGSHFIEK
jgi:L-aspartate oxidase